MAKQTEEELRAAEARTAGLVDEERLGRWMDAEGLPGAGEPVTSRFISGGASNEIFEIRRGDFGAVLRRPPRVVPKGRNETMLREFRVLDALNGTDVPHPEAFAACSDPDVIGSAFYLMSLVDGWSPMNTDGWPAPFDTDLDARYGLGIELVDGIARLARVDWRARGLEGFGKPEGFHDRQVDRWLSHLNAIQFREIPGLDVTAEWLRAHKPSHWEPGIIHGDYQFANVMFAHGAPARLAAIVDWEMTTVGDPLLDLAWALLGYDGENPRADGFYLDMQGMPTRSALLAHYEKVSGISTENIDYYLVLANWKLGIVLEKTYASAVRTGAQKGGVDPKIADAFRLMIPQLIATSAELARSLPSTRR